jgi:hypothetical protein
MLDLRVERERYRQVTYSQQWAIPLMEIYE